MRKMIGQEAASASEIATALRKAPRALPSENPGKIPASNTNRIACVTVVPMAHRMNRRMGTPL